MVASTQWTIADVLVWIVTRDLEQVDQFRALANLKPSLPDDEAVAHLNHPKDVALLSPNISGAVSLLAGIKGSGFDDPSVIDDATEFHRGGSDTCYIVENTVTRELLHLAEEGLVGARGFSPDSARSENIHPSDFSGFVIQAMPDGLRSRRLRKLVWQDVTFDKTKMMSVWSPPASSGRTKSTPGPRPGSYFDELCDLLRNAQERGDKAFFDRPEKERHDLLRRQLEKKKYTDVPSSRSGLEDAYKKALETLR